MRPDTGGEEVPEIERHDRRSKKKVPQSATETTNVDMNAQHRHLQGRYK
jgi:hypothetical protein